MVKIPRWAKISGKVAAAYAALMIGSNAYTPNYKPEIEKTQQTQTQQIPIANQNLKTQPIPQNDKYGTPEHQKAISKLMQTQTSNHIDGLETDEEKNLRNEVMRIIEKWKKNKNKYILERLSNEDENKLKEFKEKVISKKTPEEIQNLWYYQSTYDLLDDTQRARTIIKNNQKIEELWTNIKMRIDNFSEKDLLKYASKLQKRIGNKKFYFDPKRKKWTVYVDKINPKIGKLLLEISQNGIHNKKYPQYQKIRTDPHYMFTKALIESGFDNSKVSPSPAEAKSALQTLESSKEYYYPGETEIKYYFYTSFNYVYDNALKFKFKDVTKLNTLEKAFASIIYVAGETIATENRLEILDTNGKFTNSSEYVSMFIAADKLKIEYNLTLGDKTIYITPNGIKK